MFGVETGGKNSSVCKSLGNKRCVKLAGIKCPLLLAQVGAARVCNFDVLHIPWRTFGVQLTWNAPQFLIKAQLNTG